MISSNPKFIYIHIPKCASTTVGLASRRIGNTSRNRNIGLRTHSYLTEFKKKLEDYDDYFKFTFVRNSWARVLSMYFYRMKRWKNGQRPNWVTNENFIDWMHEQKDANYDLFPPRIVDYIPSDDAYDFIGHSENLTEDFQKLCDMLDVKMPRIPSKNTTRHKHWWEYYDEETRQLVLDYYAEDIKKFDYKFGLNKQDEKV